MKKSFIPEILLCIITLLCGCTDDNLVEERTNLPVHPGDNIGIGASASYHSDKNSRTIYTGVVDGPTNSEHINWILGDEGYGSSGGLDVKWVADEIRVMSIGATRTMENGQTADFADYKLIAHENSVDGTPTHNPEMRTSLIEWVKSSSGSNALEKAGQDNGHFMVAEANGAGLRWNEDPNVEHYFYGVYPDPALNPFVEVVKKKNKVTFRGKIEAEQHIIGFIKDPSKPKDATYNSYIAMPLMRQNYMWAAHKATAEEKAANAISLSFKTIPTVLEVDLVWPENTKENVTPVNSVILTCTDPNTPLTGTFETDFSRMTTVDKNGNVTDKRMTFNKNNGNAKGYPKVTFLPDNDFSHSSVTINLDADLHDGIPGVQLNPGDHLKVRFVLMPNQDFDSQKLKLTVRGPKGQKTHVLASSNGKSLKLEPHKLNRVLNVKFPAELDKSNWVTLLNDNIYLSQLSVPGTGNSYANKNHTDKNSELQTQDLLIMDQWNMGIRCFEVSVDRPSNDRVDATDFANLPLRFDNKNELNVTIGKEIQRVFALLNEPANKDEFCFLILRYQPVQARNAMKFVEAFDNFFKSLDQTKVALFEPNMTIAEARGKLMILLCPTSEGEDEGIDMSAYQDRKYLIIDGCGSLPDKFFKRGYWYHNNAMNQTLQVNKICPAADKSVRSQTAEHFIVYPDKGYLIRKKADADFTYKTNQGFNAYYQDWIRVIDGAGVAGGEDGYQGAETRKFSVGTNTYVWPSSYDEKLDNVLETFNKAVTDKENTSSVYINSLCGFLVTGNEGGEPGKYVPIYDSWPTVVGDSRALATKLNLDFYKYVNRALVSGRVRGPMGVVMMNYVGDPNNTGSMLLPSMVMMHNFSFPLIVKKNISTKSSHEKENLSTGLIEGNLDASDWTWDD